MNDARPGVFWMNDAVYDHFAPMIGVYGVAVYGYLCRRANDRAQCWPSLNGISKTLNMSRAKAVTTLDALENVGLISRQHDKDEKGGHLSTIYTLHDVTPLVHDIDKGSPQNKQALVHEVDPKEVTVEGRPSKGKRKSKKKVRSGQNSPPNHHKEPPVEPKKELKEESGQDFKEGYEWFFGEEVQ